jgi:hypothetical protein
MQEITTQVRNTVRNALPSFLNANAPIRNIEAKAKLLSELGYTREQFGFTDSRVSKIEILIGNEFFRLKKMGQVEQDGWIWKVLTTQANPIQQNHVAQQQNHVAQEDNVAQEENHVAQEENHVAQPVVEMVVQEEPEEEQEDLFISNRLLACDGYRNSLIESTECYGNYDKTQCAGCLLAFWCSPFTAQKKEERKADRQAKRQAKSAKEALLEKYADKKDNLTNLLGLIKNAVEMTNTTDQATFCMFNLTVEIAPNEKCMFVRNYGVISMSTYNEIKDAGLQ